VENPIIAVTPIGNPSGFFGIILNGPVMIFMWSEISYLNGSAVNWFVNVKCSEMMESAGEWNWKAYLGWIFADREGEDWNWYSLLFGLWI